MATADLRYVIAYDIADDKRRRRLVRVLEAYGDRVQWSLFEAVLDRPLLDNLLRQVGRVIDPDADRVLVHVLCAACEGRARRLGTSAGVAPPGEEFVFIA